MAATPNTSCNEQATTPTLEPPVPSSNKTLIVGLSGPSSSGKTTLARLLRSIFNNMAVPDGAGAGPGGKVKGKGKGKRHSFIKLFILHEDDFYKTDAEIPVVTTTTSGRHFQDWDCADAIDLPLLESTLRHIRDHHGTLPADLQSKEDQNAVGESGVTDDEVRTYRSEVEGWLAAAGRRRRRRRRSGGDGGETHQDDDNDDDNDDGHVHPTTPNSSTHVTAEAEEAAAAAATAPQPQPLLTICILDGFLLYTPPQTLTNPSTTTTTSIPPSIPSLLDLKLFLRSTSTLTKTRRRARTGYVTLEGFWEDPPGYVDEVVWPNYARDHAWMFEGGDVDQGEVRAGVEAEGGGGAGGAERGGVVFAPGKGEVEMQGLVAWGVGVLKDEMARRLDLGTNAES